MSELVLQQARALIDRRRFAQARQILAGGIQQDPDNVQLLYLCAFVDYSLGDLPSANQTIDRVLVGEPKHYGGRILRAELYESEKRYPEAEAVWIDLLRDYPQDPECYAHYADLMLRTLHFEKAERLTQEGLHLDPTHWQCLYVAYLVDVIQNRTSSVDNTHLQQLLKDHPERVQSLLALIIALDERGDSRIIGVCCLFIPCAAGVGTGRQW
jgi:tetratricopeptide (TPR) repeat protein